MQGKPEAKHLAALYEDGDEVSTPRPGAMPGEGRPAESVPDAAAVSPAA